MCTETALIARAFAFPEGFPLRGLLQLEDGRLVVDDPEVELDGTVVDSLDELAWLLDPEEPPEDLDDLIEERDDHPEIGEVWVERLDSGER